MAVTVTPETFTLVEFDAKAIARVVRKLVKVIGLPTRAAVLVEVDERVPLGRTELVSVDPIVVAVEGGALEDPKRPRQLSTDRVADAVGRLLVQARDRLDPDFGEVPPRDAIPLPVANAWDVYATGRLVAAGYPSQRGRWLYAFRNRHGFTDEADAVFDRLWEGTDPLRWDDLVALSARALAARDAVAP